MCWGLPFDVLGEICVLNVFTVCCLCPVCSLKTRCVGVFSPVFFFLLFYYFIYVWIYIKFIFNYSFFSCFFLFSFLIPSDKSNFPYCFFFLFASLVFLVVIICCLHVFFRVLCFCLLFSPCLLAPMFECFLGKLF